MSTQTLSPISSSSVSCRLPGVYAMSVLGFLLELYDEHTTKPLLSDSLVCCCFPEGVSREYLGENIPPKTKKPSPIPQ